MSTRLTDLIVICRTGDRRVGLLVPEVDDVSDLHFDGDASQQIPDHRVSFVKSVATAGTEHVLLLDVDRLVAAADVAPEQFE